MILIRVSAVRLLCGGQRDLPRSEEPTKPRPFVLPPRYPDCARVVQYLKRRGISGEVLRRCIDALSLAMMMQQAGKQTFNSKNVGYMLYYLLKNVILAHMIL